MADTDALKASGESREGSIPSAPTKTRFFQGHYNEMFLREITDPIGLGMVFALNWHQPETREAYEEMLRLQKENVASSSSEQDA